MKKALLRAFWNLPLSCASWKRRAITLRVCTAGRAEIVAVAGGLGNVLPRHDTPAGSEWLESVRAYEKEF